MRINGVKLPGRYTAWIRVLSVCVVVSLSPSQPYQITCGVEFNQRYLSPLRLRSSWLFKTPLQITDSAAQRVVQITIFRQHAALLHLAVVR